MTDTPLERAWQHVRNGHSPLGPSVALEAAWRRVARAEQRVAEVVELRKRQGAFYTPRALARYVAFSALRPHLIAAVQAADPGRLEELTVLDPAVGGGALLLAALEWLVAGHVAASGGTGAVSVAHLGRCLFGRDLDAGALEATAEALEIACGGPVPCRLEEGNSVLDPWPDGWPERMEVAVANPPFGSVNRLGRHHPTQLALAERYPVIWQDKSDLAVYFVYATAAHTERGTFILPNAAFASDKGRKFRRAMATAFQLDVLDLRDRFLFPDASVTTGLLSYQRTTSEQPETVGWRPEQHADLEVSLEAFVRNADAPSGVLVDRLPLGRWSVTTRSARARWDHMDRGQKLGARYLVGKGMETGCNKAFVLDEEQARGLTAAEHARFVRRRIRGVEITPYTLASPSRWLVFSPAAERFEDLPDTLREQLDGHRERLCARAAYRRGNCLWWQYTWPLHVAHYDAYRVITPYRSAAHRFSLVGPGEGIGLTDTTSVFTHDVSHGYALCALLMSAPVVDRFAGLTKHTGAGMMEFFEHQLREIPLPPQWDALVPALASSARALAAGGDIDAGAVRARIDERVAVAYGLS